MESTERGLLLLDEKLERLEKLKQLTNDERELIVSESDDDILKINEVLQEKKKHMLRIDEIDHEYRELVPRIDDRIRQRQQDIKYLLLEIIDMDREKNDLMQARFKSLKGDLKGVRQSIKANKAYGYEEHGNMFIDKKR